VKAITGNAEDANLLLDPYNLESVIR